MLSAENIKDLKLIILNPYNETAAFEVDAWLGDVCLGRRRFRYIKSPYAARKASIAHINKYGSLN